jgi:uncharacterized protein (TIGR02453 family)
VVLQLSEMLHHLFFLGHELHELERIFTNHMIETSTIKFLKDLKKNNNKPWFDAHRKQYEIAKQNFEEFIQTLIDKLALKDATVKEQVAKQCMFRINRDIRFSKDKTPYKSHFSASINRAGKKSIFGGYYFHLEPGGSYVGGGVWMPMPPELKKIRQEIDYCYDEFKKITQSKKFKTVYKDLYRENEVSLAKVPQGFEKDNPAAKDLKLKSWIAMQEIKDADLTGKNLVKTSLVAYETIMPLVQFVNRTMED